MTKTISPLKAKMQRDLVVSELSDDLQKVQLLAKAGRKGLWEVFAKAYVWYQKTKNVIGSDGEDYLEGNYKACDPKITKKTGVSEFNRLVKLAFDMNDPQYASTVSRYATAFDYIDRKIKKADISDAAKIKVLISKVQALISKTGGIHKCTNLQREYNDQIDAPNRKAEMKSFRRAHNKLVKQYVAEVSAKKSIATVSASEVLGGHGFVVLLGKTTKTAGSYDIIDTVDVDETTIESLLTISHAKDNV